MNRILITLLLCAVGSRVHDVALAQDTMRALARDTVHALARDTMRALAQDTMRALAQDTMRALAQDTKHTLAQDTMHALVPTWPARKIIATGAVGGIFVGSLIGSYFDWWVDASQSFHFTDDGLFNNYSLGIDKIGHAYTSYFYFHTFRNVMQWGGYEERTAFWWAAGISAFFALSVEVGDGLSPFGFSAWDLSFNMLGLAYGMAQTSVPFLQNFKLKWSYVPADGYRWPPRFTEHYDGHIYWVACNVHNLLPESAQHLWPEFLQLALGYGVDDRHTRRELMVGLDLNLSVFQTQQPELRLLEQTVDLFHIPMPSVKFTEGKTPRYYLIGWN